LASEGIEMKLRSTLCENESDHLNCKIRQALLDAIKWHRDYSILRYRVKPKRMRWERWQRHPRKTYRDTIERYRQWGVMAVRGLVSKLPYPMQSNPTPLERMCHAAFDMGARDEANRLRLVPKRKHKWAYVGSLVDHILGTVKHRIDTDVQ